MKQNPTSRPFNPLFASLIASVRLWHGGSKKGTELQRRISRALGNSMHPDDFIVHAVQKGLQEMEETGCITMPWMPHGMNAKNSRRIAELNKECGLDENDGMADALIDSTLQDFVNGDGFMIYDAYDINTKDAAKCRDAFIRLVRKWRKEDGLPPLSKAKLAKLRKEDWSVRAKRRRNTETVVLMKLNRMAKKAAEGRAA